MGRIASIFALVLAAAAPARAGLTLCNDTKRPVMAALGHNDGKAWRSDGWWRVEPGACAPLLQGELIARYYYLHAIHVGAGGGWDGNRYFCVKDARFTFLTRRDCGQEGGRAAGFFEIDTGEAADYTQRLAD